MFRSTYNSILKDFNKAKTRLEALATREENNAEAFLQQHLSIKALEADARAVAEKARATAQKIGALIG